MKAWTSPRLSDPLATRRPPITAMATKLRLPRNIIAGWITPAMNWALKLASNSSSFFALNRSSTARLLAEDLHERVTGERLLDLGVERAGVRPLLDEPLLRASGHLPHDEQGGRDHHQCDQRELPRDHEHHREDTDDGERRGEQLAQCLLEALGDVVDVIGDPTQQVASRLAVDVGERQAVDLLLDLRAQPHHRPLDDAGEDVRLQIGEGGGHDVERHHSDQDVAELVELDAVGLAGDAPDDDVGALTQDPRPEHGQRDAADGRHEHEDGPLALGAHGGEETSGRSDEVLRLLARHRRPHATEARARRWFRRDESAPPAPASAASRLGFGQIGHAASSSRSWEATIST